MYIIIIIDTVRLDAKVSKNNSIIWVWIAQFIGIWAEKMLQN